jgi:bacteriocin biosynthesis cyclodehydratase domain-containing protein
VSSKVLVMTDGLFGEQVGEALRELLTLAGQRTELMSEPIVDELERVLAGATVGIRASWRDIDAEFQEYAVAAEAAVRPFLPIAFAHPQIRVGPLVLPGEAPCHSCFCARARQHADAEDPMAAQATSAMLGQPGLGVTGYPPHLPMLAAALALQLLGESWGGTGTPRPGWVTLINVDSDHVRTWAVSTTAFCPACFPATERAALRKQRQDRLRTLAMAASGAPGGRR